MQVSSVSHAATVRIPRRPRKAPAGPGVNWRSCRLDALHAPSADLSGADLSNASLVNAELSDSDLGAADLGYANLAGAAMSYARLVGARLLGANLRGADLTHADLRDAELSHADLGGARLGLGDIPAGTHLYRYFGMDLERPSLPRVEAWYERLQERPAYHKHVMIPFLDLKGKTSY